LTDNVVPLFKGPNDPKDQSEFCLSITLFSDGRIALDHDQTLIADKEDVNWALVNIARAIADLVQMKDTLPDIAEDD